MIDLFALIVGCGSCVSPLCEKRLKPTLALASTAIFTFNSYIDNSLLSTVAWVEKQSPEPIANAINHLGKENIVSAIKYTPIAIGVGYFGRSFLIESFYPTIYADKNTVYQGCCIKKTNFLDAKSFILGSAITWIGKNIIDSYNHYDEHEHNHIKYNIGKIEDYSDNILIKDNGSKIFVKDGLKYIEAGTGVDEFYFSLCSTKIIEGKVSVISNFDINQDKIKIFCTKNKIHQEDISIIHRIENEQNITYIEIHPEHGDLTAIGLIGDIDIKINDIILNEQWL